MTETDGGVLLTKEGHEEVAEVAQQLTKFCVKEPVKNPLIFGGKMWETVWTHFTVAYCSYFSTIYDVKTLNHSIIHYEIMRVLHT